MRMLASNPLAELNPKDSDGDGVVALDEEEAEAMAASIANRHPETAAWFFRRRVFFFCSLSMFREGGLVGLIDVEDITEEDSRLPVVVVVVVVVLNQFN